MRLLVDDSLTSAQLAVPLRLGWVESSRPIETVEHLTAAALGPDDVALIDAAEATFLAEDHLIVPDVAVVADAVSAISLRTPVRPDAVERTPVRLWHVSGTAELLARATLRPFYGITATAWTADDDANAEAVVVEGVAALQPVEAGFAEDLGRAWFIMTGMPIVSHLLVVPQEMDATDWQPALAVLDQVRIAAHDRGRDFRRAAAGTSEVNRDALATLFASQRLSLTRDDRRALQALLQRGSPGSRFPLVPNLHYAEPNSSH